MKKPRPFSHSPIYYSERQSLLTEAEKRARRELGLTTSPPASKEQLRGVFASVQHHHKGKGMRFDSLKLLVFIAVAIIIIIVLIQSL